ncbi:hypothetical protein [Saccharothrix australiensis]|uniref:Tetratricopeptide repeat protein n=1 Tax=Saccharothrix australiensis TaxID=2072 RepID=A0A495VX56_9PSEU|nr:hypothetical protein [Saccharothrix australiensis]RKT54011.1 hypothetical protein C8E97_2599 [Saccharothrix australiensis]
MKSTEQLLTTLHGHMTGGRVEESAKLLRQAWLVAPYRLTVDEIVGLHHATLEFADRHPRAESLSDGLHAAAVAYYRMAVLNGATVMAARMVELWRALCVEEANDDRLCHHAFALDTLASVYRARDMPEQVICCLIDLVEMQFTEGTVEGVAWAVRELGVEALLAGDVDDAVAKLSRAEQLYEDDGADAEYLGERAECRVLLGRAHSAKGDNASAGFWFKRALEDLPDDGPLAQEVRDLVAAAGSGQGLPEARLLKVGDFGRMDWRDVEQKTCAC